MSNDTDNRNLKYTNGWAANAGGMPLSIKKTTEIRDKLLKLSLFKKLRFNKNFDRINECISYGDIQPALVVSTSPLIISAYSDEMNAVLFLRFPEQLADRYSLKPGMRLTTANVYRQYPFMAEDITTGYKYMKHYYDFQPMVRLFLCDNEEQILSQERMFNDVSWKRVEQLTEARAKKDILPRDGFYYFLQ